MIYIAILIGIVVLIISGNKLKLRTNSLPTLTDDSEYQVSFHEYKPQCRIKDKDWFVTTDKIFVLFEQYCYVSVYGINGDFLYSIQTYHINNGVERIAYKDDLLVIHTRSGGVFLFDGTEIKDYIPWDMNNANDRERNRAYYNYIVYDFHNERNNQESHYYLENNTIFCVNPIGEHKAVICFPY